MNNIINLTIPGNPVAKKRSRQGSNRRWYNPQEDIMQIVKRMIKEQLPESFKLMDSKIPIACNFIFLFSFPATLSRKSIEKYNTEVVPCLNKKDIDNLEKFYMDVMNGIVWYDDNQVYSVHAVKYYSSNPRTEIEVSW